MSRVWLKPCSVKKMTVEECAWLAGFMDGEGSISSFMGGRNKLYKSWVLSLVNTNIESLEKCKNITGAGAVRKKSKPKTDRHKQVYQWQVTAQRDIKHICEQIDKYCIVKTEQIKTFLSSWEDL